jgi:hypothetical protein
MITNQDDELAGKIVALLDESTSRLDDPIAAKLLAARKEALAHYQEKPARAWAPAWVTAAAGRIAEPFGQNLRAGFVVLALLASLAGFVAWQSFGQQVSETADIDQALLTEELPINAFLDKGADSWLKRP